MDVNRGNEMKKVIVSVKLRDILIGILIFNICIVIFSLIVVGVNKGNRQLKYGNTENKQIEHNNSKVDLDLKKEKDTIFNKKIDCCINLYLTREKRIVKLDLEQYVLGVVSAEMPANFNIEALKAQAVAARTYAVCHTKHLVGGGCSLNVNADICDSVHCQAYISQEKRMKTWPKKERAELYNKVKEAVESTRGQVLSYYGELVMNPYYFATSSGKTENSEEVFKESKPYLKSVESPGEEVAPKYKTQFKFSNANFTTVMNSQFKGLNLNSNIIKDKINILERSQGGSIKQIKIGNITTTGKMIRKLFGLPSANFTISFESTNIVFNCKGYGHGVGMSQWGAGVMAREGKKYDEILRHYYSGIEIKTLNYK